VLLTTLIAYGLIAVFFLTVERRRENQAARTFQKSQFDGGSQRVLAIGIVIVELGLIFSPVLNHFGIGRFARREIVGWMGVALMVGGIVLRNWAGRVLGAFYTRTLRVQDGQHIVREGPYRVIRHPGYAGALLLWVGAVVAVANWIAIVVVTPIIIGAYVYRIHCEEKMLANTFGKQYEIYRIQTKKLVPFFY
jgi:protein-S-isoprenylcysteine O-methyltransferase Ste14